MKSTGHHRVWRWVALLLMGTLVLAACGNDDEATESVGGETPTEGVDEPAAPTEEPAETEPEPEAPTEEPAEQPVEEVTLEIQASQPELLNSEQQIWDLFEAQNPGVTVELFAVNEDQRPAYQARRAGGYFPAIETHAMPPIDTATAGNYVNLLDVDIEWLDRFQYDVRATQAALTGVEGLYTLDPRSGRFITWQYNADLMDELGLDPRSVKTQADLLQLLADGTAAVEARDDIDFFWDQGWQPWIFGANYLSALPLGYQDGQMAEQEASWLGQVTDPAEDPFRHTFQWMKEAYDAGALTQEFWLREWETDMEASYLAGKSVMMLHGPWPWDKMLGENPDARQLGIPATPPENEGDPWRQWVSSPNIDNGYRIPIENLDSENWDIVLAAFNFWNSPEAVRLQAQVLGVSMAYDLDESLEIEGPQWEGIVKEFQPGGLYEDVVLVNQTDVISKFKVEEAGAYWDWQWNDIWADVMTDQMTIDEALDWFHGQVATDYEIS